MMGEKVYPFIIKRPEKRSYFTVSVQICFNLYTVRVLEHLSSFANSSSSEVGLQFPLSYSFVSTDRASCVYTDYTSRLWQFFCTLRLPSFNKRAGKPLSALTNSSLCAGAQHT